MLSLAALQRSIRQTIQTGDLDKDLVSEVVSTELDASARLQIYQNNYREPLIQGLLDVFPIVSAFVGEVFTRTALRHFIEEKPPAEPCLSNYGDKFSSFLRGYEAAGSVPYLGDIAALEWAVYKLQHVAEVEARGGVRLGIIPKAIFIDSSFPLLNLWMVGNGQLQAEAVHVDQGGQYVCVALHDIQVQLYALSEAEQAVIVAVKNGEVHENNNVTNALRNKGVLINQ